MKRRPTTILIAYAAAPLLTALMTWAMASIQTWLLGHPAYGTPRVFTTLFFGVIALITMLGGRGPGLWTVALSVFSTAFFVMLPRNTLAHKTPADWLQLLLFFGVGITIVLGVEALATNRRLLARSEEAQARLRTVMDTAPVGVLLSDTSGTVSYANREAERIWGHPLRRAPSGHDARLLDGTGTPLPPEREPLAQALASGGQAPAQEHLVEQPGGTRVWVESTAAVVRGGTGKPVGGLVVMGDITARKQSEMALRAREERFRSLVQNASDIITVLAEDGTVLYKSPSEERILGFHPDETTGRPVWEMLHPDDIPRVGAAFAQVLGAPGLHPPIEFRISHKAGGWRTLEATPSNLLHDTSIGGIVVNSRDITERKASEQEIRGLLIEGEKKVARETLLSTIAQTVLETPDPEAVLAVTVAGLGPVLGADRCYLVTYDMAAGTSRIGPEWHRDGLPDIAGDYVIADYGFNHDARYLSGQTYAVADTFTLEDRPTEALARLGLRALLRVPVRSGNQVTALAVAMANTPREWLPGEVSLVETVVSQARMAVESALLQQREHHIATALQNALMPALPEQVPGLDLAAFYRPALEESSLGGDFHDVFPLDKGLFALVVGDVSGKGLAAAAQVATLRQMLRYALYMGTSHGQDLAQSISELNSQVVAHDLLLGFVTLFVGIYDSAASRLCYVNAGQEPALLRRAGTTETLELSPTGPVLGMDIDGVFTQETRALLPGDALAIYTDGMSEAGRGQQDLLGVSGIAQLMAVAPPAAAAQVDFLVSGMNAHAEGRLHDDVCLLVAVAQGGEPG